MNGKRLRTWRVQHKQTQAGLAQLLGVSQKCISTWETTSKSIPSWAQERLNGQLNGKGDEGKISPIYSWAPAVFEALRRHVAKQAKEVFVRAIISPSETEPNKFADFVGEVRFVDLVLAEQILYHDHVRDSGVNEGAGGTNLVLGGTNMMPESMENIETTNKDEKKNQREVVIRQGEGALLVEARDKDDHVIQTRELGTISARLDEDLTVRGPKYLAYEIRNADADSPVSVFIRSKRGYSLSSRDSVGYAYYAEGDFLVERIHLQVEFKAGLIPEPMTPTARAQLIRRTSLRPTSSDSNLPEPTKAPGEHDGSLIYTFGPLLRPKSGFLYSLVWRKLVAT
jgi:transcriptional regulator with XRE-family HTH domain